MVEIWNGRGAQGRSGEDEIKARNVSRFRKNIKGPPSVFSSFIVFNGRVWKTSGPLFSPLQYSERGEDRSLRKDTHSKYKYGRSKNFGLQEQLSVLFFVLF